MSDVPVEAPEEPVTAEPELLHGAVVTRDHGQFVAHPSRQELVDLVRTLRHEGWLQCLDVTAVDHLARPTPVSPPSTITTLPTLQQRSISVWPQPAINRQIQLSYKQRMKNK